MTNPTIVKIQGHIDIFSAQTYTLGTAVGGFVSPYAWGIYVDKDIASNATALPPYSLGYTSTWMAWKTGTITAGAFYTDATRAAFLPNSFDKARHTLNLTKYKRKLDSFNDTLVLSIENASASFVMGYDFYFRMLLLE